MWYHSTHECRNTDRYGDWRFADHNSNLITGYVLIHDLLSYLVESKLRILELKDICAKCMCSKSYTTKERHESADISYPGIVCEYGRNPKNLKYRLIDGEHRYFKILNSYKSNPVTGKYYVLSTDHILKHIRTESLYINSPENLEKNFSPSPIKIV